MTEWHNCTCYNLETLFLNYGKKEELEKYASKNIGIRYYLYKYVYKFNTELNKIEILADLIREGCYHAADQFSSLISNLRNKSIENIWIYVNIGILERGYNCPYCPHDEIWKQQMNYLASKWWNSYVCLQIKCLDNYEKAPNLLGHLLINNKITLSTFEKFYIIIPDLKTCFALKIYIQDQEIKQLKNQIDNFIKYLPGIGTEFINAKKEFESLNS